MSSCRRANASHRAPRRTAVAWSVHERARRSVQRAAHLAHCALVGREREQSGDPATRGAAREAHARVARELRRLEHDREAAVTQQPAGLGELAANLIHAFGRAPRPPGRLIHIIGRVATVDEDGHTAGQRGEVGVAAAERVAGRLDAERRVHRLG